MTRSRMRGVLRAGAASLLVLSSGGCVDEKIVYRSGPDFVRPPAAAANFVGYMDRDAKETVCGACHVSQQGKWEVTAHADAFATLENSGHMQGACQRCHTVNNLGNAVTDTAVGWRSTKDVRFHDVQCESCHGSGLQHITTPARGQMLPSIAAAVGASVTNGCGECHSGTHHPFAEEWSRSAHAVQPEHQYEDDGTPNPGCQGCHIGQYVLAAWGVNTNYVEKDAGAHVEGGQAITCAVCHDPHGSPYTAQLRFAVDARDAENNLCAKCHNRRSAPDWSSSRDEPHAPQGPLVFGTAGWWPPGINFDETQSTHGSTANPKLCATCHVQHYDVSDKVTGQFQVTVTGHRFLAVPCVDANGAPTDVQDCADNVRSFRSCASSTCHGNSPANARTAFITAKADIAGLAALLDGMIAQVPADQFGRNKVTVGRGAKFNSFIAKDPGSEAHNPFMVKALLRYSGVALRDAYGIPLPPGLAPTAADRARVRSH
jgi:predicted CXXCH cytochrome family protein